MQTGGKHIILSMTADLSQHLYSASQIRMIEQHAIDRLEIPGYELMTRAGNAVFKFLLGALDSDSSLLVLCGPGNNAGDGYVVAALLLEAGYSVSLISLTDQQLLKGDAAQARDDWIKAGGKTDNYSGQLPATDLVIDALFGTGLSRPLEGNFQQLVEQVNESGKPVLSIDIPSGLCSESGRVLGTSIRADTTVTFIGLKAGQFLLDGPDHCGELLLDDLDVPSAAYADQQPVANLIDESALSRHLSPRARNSHKGDFGHVLVIGGGVGMSGAVRMAAEAAARCGAGLVTVATHPQHAENIAASCPVLMSHGISETSQLRALLKKATTLAFGPGLGQDEWARALFSQVMESKQLRVIDADGLNLLADNPQKCEQQLMTPHPGEAGRLLGVSTAEIQNDRILAVQKLQQKYGGVVVLKGQGSLVSDGETIWLCPYGNPGMASGGMGDVLTGIIAGLLAQGLPLLAAAKAGVLIHAMAADKAAGTQPRGLLATDLLPLLREFAN